MAVRATNAAPSDPRSIVIFEQQCASDRGSQVVTLFANGTVRLKIIEGKEPESVVSLYLLELSPEETEALRGQLRDSLPTDGYLPERDGGDVSGLGVEHCRMTIDTERRRPIQLIYGPLEVPSLRVERWQVFAADLVRRALPKEEPETLDEAYKPRIGDILLDTTGQRYRVRWISIEGLVELDGIDQPIHMRVALAALGETFVRQVASP